MSLRVGLRAFLAADNAYLALLPGGLYPDPALTPPDQAELTRLGTPAAFDDFGDVRPSGLIVEDGTTPFGPLRDAGQAIVRVLKVQRAGRDVIEAANAREKALLHGARLLIDGRARTFRWAGDGPTNLTDPGLRDAALGWTRWQITGLFG